MYANVGNMLYKHRKNTEYYELSKAFYLKQIKISKKVFEIFKSEFDKPVGHTGFKQLAIILEKEKHYQKALNICREAAEQGWAGDGDIRIERLNTKLF